MIREGADAQIDAGQIETLAGAQAAADYYVAANLGSVYLSDFQFYVTVVEK
jgi:hypothetical protein